jgi:3-oxoacyl-[acyl-carrier-protein] synthase-3
MAGADVFLWTRNKVAKQIAVLIEHETLAGRAPHTIFLHQASKLVVDSLKGLLPKSITIPTNFEAVGNTVSSSIPILLTANLDVLSRPGSLLLAGFGVGLSSSVVAIEIS